MSDPEPYSALPRELCINAPRQPYKKTSDAIQCNSSALLITSVKAFYCSDWVTSLCCWWDALYSLLLFIGSSCRASKLSFWFVRFGDKWFSQKRDYNHKWQKTLICVPVWLLQVNVLINKSIMIFLSWFFYVGCCLWQMPIRTRFMEATGNCILQLIRIDR